MKLKQASHSSNKKHFPWKVISIFLVVVVILGLLVGCAVNWKFPQNIFIAGSSTMQPLLNEISKKYKAAEISAISGGSSYGISSVLENKKNIGSLSKSPSVEVAGLPSTLEPNATQEQWKDSKIKTITIGKDSIGIVYRPINANEELVIDENNIAMFYLAFCGYQKITLNELNSQLSASEYLVPFARSGGSNESGTAESFLLDNYLGTKGSKNYLIEISATKPNLTEISANDGDSLSIYDVLLDGSYGKYTERTNEANLETWESIKSYNVANAVPITYLSAGFIKNNYSEIVSNGFKVAKYSTNETELIIKNNNVLQINDAYNWFRPLNLIMKTEEGVSTLEDSKYLIEWIVANTLFKNSIVSKIFDQLGFSVLTSEYITTMFNPNELTEINKLISYANANPSSSYDAYLLENNNKMDWSSFWSANDYTLYDLQKNQRDQRKQYYGAILRTTSSTK